MAHIREKKLYTGDWATNLAARRARVGQILSFVSKTFDPALCEGVVNDIESGKHDAVARKHCPCGWRAPVRHDVDEYGEISTWRDRNVADWRFVSIFLSVVEYLLVQDKNQDDTIPVARAEALWRLLEARGVVDVAFCPRKWAIVRNELERRQIITVDHTWYRGKAMCWWPGPFFPGLGLWKAPKPKKMLEPMPLAEFLEEKKEEGEEHNTYMEHNNGCSPSVALTSRGPPSPDTIRGSPWPGEAAYCGFVTTNCALMSAIREGPGPSQIFVLSPPQRPRFSTMPQQQFVVGTLRQVISVGEDDVMGGHSDY